MKRFNQCIMYTLRKEHGGQVQNVMLSLRTYKYIYYSKD